MLSIAYRWAKFREKIRIYRQTSLDLKNDNLGLKIKILKFLGIQPSYRVEKIISSLNNPIRKSLKVSLGRFLADTFKILPTLDLTFIR